MTGRAPQSHEQPQPDPFAFTNFLMQQLVYAVELGAAEEVAKEEWRHQALHDQLTGLLHKRPFLDAANERLAVARPDQVFAMALIDLDNFKAVNDLHPDGHDEGDRVLATVGGVLLEKTRHDEVLPDLVAHGRRDDSGSSRLGGDEFAAFAELEGRNERGEAMPAEEREAAFSNRLARELQAPFRNRPDLDELNFGASVGIVLRHPGESAEQMLSRSDRELRVAKRLSRARQKGGAYRTFQLD